MASQIRSPIFSSLLTTFCLGRVVAQDLFLDATSSGLPSGGVGSGHALNSASVVTIQPWGGLNLCLDYSNAHGNDLLQLWECNGHENQLFYFDPNSWDIKLGSDRSKCLDVGSWPAKAGTGLVTSTCSGHSSQKWGYDSTVGQETIYLADSMTDATYCMDMSGGVAGMKAGTVVEIWNCNGGLNQKWWPSNGITLRLSFDYSWCIDLDISKTGNKPENGTPIQLWKCNGRQNQKWSFDDNKIITMMDTPKPMCIDAGDVLKTGKPLNLQLWECWGGQNQDWGWDGNMNTIYLSYSSSAIQTSNAGFLQRNDNSGELGAASGASFCMDLAGGDARGGALLDVWACNSCWNQQFQVIGPTSNPTSSNFKGTPPANTHLESALGAGGCPTKPSPAPTPAPGGGKLLAHCGTKPNGAGWPKFNKPSELQASPWGAYFKIVYGEIPSAANSYPICIDSLQFLYQPALVQAKISYGHDTPGAPAEVTPTKAGTFFTDPRWFQMSFALWIYNPIFEHPRARNQGLPANTWIEVLHNAFSMDGDATWFYYAPGTAVYMNTGNTKVYVDHNNAVSDLLKEACQGGGHNECVPQFSRLYAAGRKAGLSSIQFTDHGDMQCGKGGNCLLAIEVVDFGGPGTTTCSQTGTGWLATRFRSGWEAKSTCTCNSGQKTINCRGFALDGLAHR